MAKKRESRHGKIPDGWVKQGLQLPEVVSSEFKHHAESFGSGGVKFLGTVAVDLVNRMPDEVRKELAANAYRTTWPDPNAHDPGGIWSIFIEMITPTIEQSLDWKWRPKLHEIGLRNMFNNLLEQVIRLEEDRHAERVAAGENPDDAMLVKLRMLWQLRQDGLNSFVMEKVKKQDAD